MFEAIDQILRCPITKRALRKMGMNEIQNVNNLISKKQLFHFDGIPAEKEIKAGFISLDGRFAYPVIEGIAILLRNGAIALNQNRKNGALKFVRTEKKCVKDFYDQVGWKKGKDGLFIDTLKNVDLRTVTKDYIHRCHLRVRGYLKPKGKYILDAGSGPIPHFETLAYSDNYEFRICIDISILALKEAKRKLGDKGIYILSDIVNLPLKDNSVDAAISLHVIYHVPKDEQSIAFREIHRVLKPGSSAVVVYSWGGHSLLMKLAPAQKTSGKEETKPSSKSRANPEPRMYFCAQSYEYFAGQKWKIDLDILIWSSVNTRFTKKYIHRWLFGKQILSVIYWLEDKFPHLAGRFGQYPAFIIKK